MPEGIEHADLSFSEDVDLLRRCVDVIVLGDSEARIAVVPAYQGRVMTSTAAGPDGTSFGWINHAHIASGEIAPRANVFGGEERFWLGPEGGQFSIFFPPGAPFDLDHWQTPHVIDTDPFAVVAQSDAAVGFRHHGTVTNRAGSTFDFQVDRTVELLTREQAREALGQALQQVSLVAYRSTNRLTNVGESAWTHATGLLSIWILGMYKPGPRTTIVLPFRAGDVGERGPIVNDSYFGRPPPERLRTAADTLFFCGDGQRRGKIGLSPRRAREICGSWDAARGVLTIVTYNQPSADVTDYVNSLWEMQQYPYAGDVVNAYNDGPPTPGAEPMGPFLELETSSPALQLVAGEHAEHVQQTFHFEGARAPLDRLARSLLGVSLAEIEGALA